MVSAFPACCSVTRQRRAFLRRPDRLLLRSRPAWPVTVTLTSYSPHVSANTFLPPVKPLPWNYQAASIVSRPLITPVAVAGAHGYLWFAGSGMVARTVLYSLRVA